MKKKSLITQTARMIIIHSTLLLAVFLTYIFVSYRTALNDLEMSNYNLIQLYGRELGNKLENADMLLERLIYKNDDYDLLQSSNESKRYHAGKRLSDYIQEQIIYDPYIDAVMIAESQYQMILDYENTEINLTEKEQLRQFTLRKAEEEHAKAEWNIATIGSGQYIYKMYVWQGKSAGVFISVHNFMEDVVMSDFQNVAVVLTDQKDRIWGKFGDFAIHSEVGEIVKTNQKNSLMHTTEYELADGKMRISAYISMAGIFGQIRGNMIIVLAMLMILGAFSILLMRFLSREMITPMRHMQASMESMQQGKYELRIREEYGNKEFDLLKQTFNRLMDEIVGLKIQSYEKQIDLQETELKCVKLQIRPHFFLNAMTTISSLSQQGKNKEITAYIAALSKNIRYMFRSGLHTVPLEEEVRHVENYFEMQELKYPGCVFYYIDIPEELGEWRIPQMIIHTIIENEYKYAVNVEQMLTILIRGQKVSRDGEEMLLLEIEDDGEGYPKEVLERINGSDQTQNQTGERVGLTSVKRMMELMYEKKHLFSISNIEPHGCKNTFWVPKQAVQELKEQKQIKID